MLETKSVGDNFKCCWRFWSICSPTSTIFLDKRRATTFKRCYQHQNSVTNIHSSSSTFSHQHNGVTNITVTLTKRILSIYFDIIFPVLLTSFSHSCGKTWPKKTCICQSPCAADSGAANKGSTDRWSLKFKKNPGPCLLVVDPWL